MPGPVRPSSIHYPFAEAAVAPYINTLPDTPTGTALASWQQGFPPVTMTPLAGGGSPPYGADFNGALNLISAGVQWSQLGGQPVFDSTLASAQGGYPVGAVLALSDGYSFVINTTAGNTNNPNSGIGGGTGWAPYGGLLSLAGSYATVTGTANALVIATQPPLTTNRNGTVVTFKTVSANTNTVTLNAGGGVVPLVRNDGVALAAGDLVSGAVYTAVYDSTSASWVLKTPVVSNFARGSGVAAPGNNGTNLSNTTPLVATTMYVTPKIGSSVLVNTAMAFSNVGTGVTPALSVYYGTGTAPSVAAAPGGTLLASVGIPTGASSPTCTLSLSDILTGLTPNTRIWLALCYSKSSGAGTFDYVNFGLTGVEI